MNMILLLLTNKEQIDDENLYKLVIWFVFDSLQIFQTCAIIQLKTNNENNL